MNTTHIRTSKYYPCYSVVYYYSYVSFAMEKNACEFAEC